MSDAPDQAPPRLPGKVKYVVLLRGGLQIPVICPADMGVEHAKLTAGGHVVSAGFAYTDDWEAHGESVSLGTKSRPEQDTALLRKYFMGEATTPCPAAAGPVHVPPSSAEKEGM